MLIHLYLDLDAPLNVHDALTDHSPYPKAWPDYQAIGNGQEAFSPSMIAAVNGFISKHQVVPHWASSNHADSGPWGESVGLAGSGQWPWLDTRGHPGIWGKHHSVRQHVIDTMPDRAIWIDDHLRDEHAASLWAARNRVLALAPSGRHGITPAMLEQMKWFVTA